VWADGRTSGRPKQNKKDQQIKRHILTGTTEPDNVDVNKIGGADRDEDDEEVF
jgi:hypothetical protein